MREKDAALDEAAFNTYPKLSSGEVKALVVDDKWMASLEASIAGETTRVAQALTKRVKELADRYGKTLPALTDDLAALEKAVAEHLNMMGYS